eukprot:TRINITY_DN365_c0_g3_i1.p1 TRINITY_DN365_c0_g3~~TRINITY_DN365_c0_g3_i1.p1  ORF type:complete len:367 (+),score=-11.93 TRINITY_DN365_c0_g3_i1:236-1336(+)
MTPGLALFYGGMTSKRSVVSMMMQSFLSLCITDLVWWAYGYSLAFGEDQGGVIGSGQKCFLIGVKLTDPAPQNPKIPEMVIHSVIVFTCVLRCMFKRCSFSTALSFLSNLRLATQHNTCPSLSRVVFLCSGSLQVIFVYQLMFAIITPALISGALGNKMHFKAWFVFQILWITLVYVPWCHWIWGGGWLWQHGIRDFAGGIVVHCTAGFSALGCTLWMQRRRAPQSQSDNSAHKLIESKPHNLPLFALGTGLLWFGWYGFNAGSELAVDQVTVLAFVNTDLAASAAAISWLVVDWVMTGKPKFAGLLVGSVAGLVAITPGSGYVEPWAAVTIGVIVSPVCYAAVRLRQFMEWDDALDVWGCHGVGG